MRLLVTAGMSDYKLRTKLAALAESDAVSAILVVRRTPINGLPKVRSLWPGPLVGRSRVLFELWRTATMARCLRGGHFDAVIGIQPFLHGAQAVLAAQRAGIPALVGVIGSDIHRNIDRPVLGAVITWALRHGAAVVVLGPRARARVAAVGVDPQRLVEIQNYHDPERFSPAAMDPRWDLLFVGELLPRKRVGALIDAFAEVSASHPNLRMGVVGEGPERHRLTRRAARRGVGGQVEFLGYRQDVEVCLRRSRVFALVSRTEGIPAAAIEATLCGTPVVLTDVADVRAVYHEGNAWLVPTGDHRALVAALRALLSQPEVHARYAKAARDTREHFLRQWSMARLVERWEQTLHSMAVASSPGRGSRRRNGPRG